METLATKVVNLMVDKMPRSNWSIAWSTGAPEPSVRRVTRQLTEKGLLRATAGYHGKNRFTWAVK